MNQSEQYQRCLVMSGGGMRFAYYLGMYSAAVDSGRPPELLLASCGGSIAAAVIHALPDDASRKDWVASPAMYRFMQGLASTPKAAIGRALLHAARRRLSPALVGRIPDLFEDYFFDIPAALPLPPAQEYAGRPALAIVGARMLFGERDVGKPRAGRKLYAETVFCDARSAALLAGMASPMSDASWGQHAIATAVETDITMPVADAVRISIADMFYFRCHTMGERHYMGGVVDLFPIEVAQRLARAVAIEMKSPFTGLATPALRAVLGFDGNRRLRHVHAQEAEAWVDTSDVELALKHSGAMKKLDWIGNRIRIAMPPDLATYQAHVDAQWKYGYRRGQEAFAHPEANHKAHMRFANKLNRGAL